MTLNNLKNYLQQHFAESMCIVIKLKHKCFFNGLNEKNHIKILRFNSLLSEVDELAKDEKLSK